MVVAALLSITVVPVLISLLVRGRVRSGDRERREPLARPRLPSRPEFHP